MPPPPTAARTAGRPAMMARRSSVVVTTAVELRSDESLMHAEPAREAKMARPGQRDDEPRRVLPDHRLAGSRPWSNGPARAGERNDLHASGRGAGGAPGPGVRGG